MSTSWHVQGVGDFNGDGKSDVLWRADSGAIVEWQSTGPGFTQTVISQTGPGSNWHVAAVADFNGDGKADILWENSTGALQEWQSTGSGFNQGAYSGVAAAGETLLGAFDFNGDHQADLLFRTASGAYDVWESTGNSFIQHVSLPASVEAAFAETFHHYDII